jgi:TatD DNase family protein
MNQGWIDIHTHLNFLKDTTPEKAVAEAQAAGVARMITIGTEPDDHSIVLALAKKHFPVVGCTLGVHPHEGRVYNDEVEAWLNAHLAEPEVVAVGEIGLDYYYLSSPADEQNAAFRRQMQLAEKFALPVEIHTRDAEADTVEILREFRGRVRGVIHCFTGTAWLAEQALDCGYNLSFSGVVTFKKAEELRAVVRTTPLDRMHVETDAPFLAPVPHRGTQNTPAFVVHTAKVVAELKGIDEAQLREATWQNAHRVFPKLRLEEAPTLR